MRISMCFAATFLTAANLHALELEALRAADIRNLDEISVPAPQTEPAGKASKAYQYLWMHINTYSAAQAAQAHDYAARMDVTVRRVFDTQFNVDARIDNNYEWSSVRKPFGDQYQMSGNGIWLNMNGFGSGYSVSGSVMDGNNQYKYLNLTLYRSFDDFSYNISGFGLNLNADRNGISGGYNPDEYSKKAIAAAASLILALQLDKAQTPAVRKK